MLCTKYYYKRVYLMDKMLDLNLEQVSPSEDPAYNWDPMCNSNFFEEIHIFQQNCQAPFKIRKMCKFGWTYRNKVDSNQSIEYKN